MSAPARIAFLDQDPQPSFDALAAAAARIFAAPIALILLQDGDRLWYKSRLGVEWLECPVRGSFSRWLLAHDEPHLAVPDAARDPRFRDDEAVIAGLGIHFYAGAPILAPDGVRIGAICVMDYAPRDGVDPADMAVLAGLGRSVAALIDSLRQAVEMKRLQARSRLSDDLGEIALRPAGYASALAETAEVLGRHLGADLVLLTRYDPAVEGLWSTGAWSTDPALAGRLTANVAAVPLRDRDSPGFAAIRDQETLVIEDVASDPRFAGARITPLLQQNGILQYLVVPLRVSFERCGITIGFRRSGNDLAALQDRVLAVRSRIAALLERKEAHDRLTFLGSILDQSGEGMSVLEVDPREPQQRRFVYVNSTMTRLTGYSRQELLGATTALLQPKSDDPAGMARTMETLMAGQPVELELQNSTKSGALIWVNIRIVPYRPSAAGAPGPGADGRQFLICSARDVGERRRMLAELRDQEGRARKLFEKNPVPMWLYDRADLRLRDVNAAALRDYGYDRETFLAMHLPDLHPREDQAQLQAHLSRPRIGLRDVGVWRQIARDGTQRHVKIVANDFSGALGNLILVAALDVTREKVYEASLLQAKYQAEQANAIKSEFLAHMSHEMRTPLNAIMGFADLMRAGIHGPLGAPQYGDYVEAIGQGGNELLMFVNDVLQLVEIDASLLSLRIGTVALRTLLLESLRQHGEGFARNNLRLAELRVPADLSVVADQRAVRQVLGQILENLVQFCDGALVTISAELRGGQVALSIADNGPGIQEEVMAEIFSPFFSSSSATRRLGQGAGLGLPICHRLLRLQGGDMRVESRSGEGTQVTILLPSAQAPAREMVSG